VRQIPVEPESDKRIPDKPILRDDPKFASQKIAFLQYFTVGVFLFLITGYWDLQVRNPEVYKERAERNRIKSLPLIAPRGKILDRDGRVVVDNAASYRLLLSRETLKAEHLRPIADGMGLDYNELVDRLRRFDRTRPKYQPIILKEELTPADVAFVESHNDPDFFPEMELVPAQRRVYPRTELAAHLIGYVGEVSENELDSADFAKYEQGDIVGKAGIERQYNDLLKGVDGQRSVVVDYRGHEHEVLSKKEFIPGKSLQLTIDLDLQVVAELAMEDRRGAVVALDPRTGEVLAMVSRPAYDPNKFTGRINAGEWKNLVGNPDNPLLNRAIQAQFAPGSTFKPVMSLAGLDTGVIDTGTSFHCAGGASFYGHYHACHIKRGHGTLSLHRAIVGSCDVFFYNVGNRLGIDRIAQYAELVGFGQKTGVDLPNEKEGLVPSTKWKIRAYRQKWYPGETISVAIGQGALVVTPIQLAYAIGGLAMGGRWFRPHLRHDVKPEVARTADLNPDFVREVVSGMYGVVNEGGTGAASILPGIQFCGKTGTAQLASNEFLKGTKQGRLLKDNAWFVGFAPRDTPEIVVAALFEGGEHGNLAGPIVRDVVKAYFDKKARAAPKPNLLARKDDPAPPPPPAGPRL
jgi:penicillin-binding protein 2